MEPQSKSIHEFFMKGIGEGDIQLPEFQRDFEWRVKQRRELLESILVEHPIGTILLLEINRDDPVFAWINLEQCDVPDHRKYVANAERHDDPPRFLILDGQQRLTTLFQITRNRGTRSWYFNLSLMYQQWKSAESPSSESEIRDWLENSNVDLFSCIYSSSNSQQPFSKLTTKELMYPVCLLESEDMRDNGIDKFCDTLREQKKSIAMKDIKGKDTVEIDPLELARFVNGTFRRVTNKYFRASIPTVFIGEGTSLQGVCKVFTKINTTGTPLGPFDLTVAKLYAKGVNLREKRNDALVQHPPLEFLDSNKFNILSTIALFDRKSPKKSNLPKTIEKELIDSHWENSLQGILDVGRYLEESSGVRIGNGGTGLICYNAIIPPMAVSIYEAKRNREFSVQENNDFERKITCWYYSSALHSRYSEGTDNKQTLDREAFYDWFMEEGNSKRPLWMLEQKRPSLKIKKKDSALGVAVLNLLHRNSPRDFHKDNLTVGACGKGSAQLHHIFPYSAMRELIKKKTGKIGKELTKMLDSEYHVNSILNLTYMTDTTNNDIISDKMPSEYIREMLKIYGGIENEHAVAKVKSILLGHFISEEGYYALLADDFELFLDSREKNIYNEIASLGVSVALVESKDEEDLEDDSED